MTSGEATTTEAGYTTQRMLAERRPQLPAFFWFLGILLIVGYVLQAVAGLPPLVPETMRTGLTFRSVTGLLLLVLLAIQFYVPFLRFNRRFSDAHRNLALHESMGVIGLLFLYVHAPTLGQGYLLVLATVMLANTALGLLTTTSRRSRNRVFRMLWLGGHIATSSFLVILAVFHVGHALYYE